MTISNEEIADLIRAEIDAAQVEVAGADGKYQVSVISDEFKRIGNINRYSIVVEPEICGCHAPFPFAKDPREALNCPSIAPNSPALLAALPSSLSCIRTLPCNPRRSHRP